MTRAARLRGVDPTVLSMVLSTGGKGDHFSRSALWTKHVVLIAFSFILQQPPSDSRLEMQLGKTDIEETGGSALRLRGGCEIDGRLLRAAALLSRGQVVMTQEGFWNVGIKCCLGLCEVGFNATEFWWLGTLS